MAILTKLSILDGVGIFRYEILWFWKTSSSNGRRPHLGSLSSGEYIQREIYGARFILPGQNFTSRLKRQDRIEGMIFGFCDPDLGQTLGFSKDLAKWIFCSQCNDPIRITQGEFFG